jgi:hypothetical protein
MKTIGVSWRCEFVQTHTHTLSTRCPAVFQSHGAGGVSTPEEQDGKQQADVNRQERRIPGNAAHDTPAVTPRTEKKKKKKKKDKSPQENGSAEARMSEGHQVKLSEPKGKKMKQMKASDVKHNSETGRGDHALDKGEDSGRKGNKRKKVPG